jgi:hypothetical protein
MEIDNFDAREVDITPDFETIPNGIYDVIVESAERKDFDDGRGQGVVDNFKLQIVKGEHKGRTVKLQIVNTSTESKWITIGRKALARLKLATNQPTARTAEELFNRVFKVELRANKAGYVNVHEIIIPEPKKEKTKLEKLDVAYDDDEISFA